MSTDREITREEAHDWVVGCHAQSATLSMEPWFSGFMDPELELQYGNLPLLKGAASRDMFESIMVQLTELTHDILYFDFVAPRMYHGLSVRYLVKGDEPKDVIVVPAFVVNYLKRGPDGKPKCYRTEAYLDPSPLFGRMKQKTVQSQVPTSTRDGVDK